MELDKNTKLYMLVICLIKIISLGPMIVITLLSFIGTFGVAFLAGMLLDSFLSVPNMWIVHSGFIIFTFLLGVLVAFCSLVKSFVMLFSKKKTRICMHTKWAIVDETTLIILPIIYFVLYKLFLNAEIIILIPFLISIVGAIMCLILDIIILKTNPKDVVREEQNI